MSTKRGTSRRGPSASARTASVCASCGDALARPFVCGKCGALSREPVRLDHFAFFGLERRFDLDEPALEKAYLELSRLLHPDRHKGSARSLALSATMNAAYAVLKNPMKRAEYLLGLLGGKTAEQDKRTPPDFLAEQLELREEVEEAKAAKDRAKLTSRLASVESGKKAGLDRLRALFGKGKDGETLAELRLELNALKYVANLEEELRAALAAAE